MLKFHTIQAKHGDCFLVEFGDAQAPRFGLIDGGPSKKNYYRHLKPVLEETARRTESLAFVMLSHVDGDHIGGLLQFFFENLERQENDDDPVIGIDDLWFNTFSDTIDGDGNIENRIAAAVQTTNTVSSADPEIDLDDDKNFLAYVVSSISQGDQLTTRAGQLEVPVNKFFGQDLVTIDSAGGELQLSNLTLRVVGPTQANLDALRKKWEDWLEEEEKRVSAADPTSMSDESKPNLSSLMIHIEADGGSLLLTGDGRGDHLLDGLGLAGLLDSGGRCHVDVLKVAHHGSNRNATRAFFDKVTADRYVISGDGNPKFGRNPDLSTLIWIVESAHNQGRQIEIFITNSTPETRQFVREYDPNDYGYRLEILPRGDHAAVIDIA